MTTQEAAIHEAGHATAALALGVPVARVHIRRRAGRRGEITFNVAGLDARTVGIIAVAGGVAERLVSGDDSKPVEFSPSDLTMIPAKHEERLELIEASLAILKEWRTLLDSVACELLERKELTGQVLNRLWTLSRDVPAS